METKQINVKGGLIEMIELLSHADCPPDPLTGAVLDRIAKILSEWSIGPKFEVDCYLSGLDPENTKLVVAEIAACAQNKESVAFY